MEVEDIQALKILSRKYVMSEKYEFLAQFLLIFYRGVSSEERIDTQSKSRLIRSKRTCIKDNKNDQLSASKKRKLDVSENLKKKSEESILQPTMFDLSKKSLQDLNRLKGCSLEIIRRIKEYYCKDNIEDQKICKACIDSLIEGLILIQQKINTDEEQKQKDQLREFTSELEELEPPGKEDISLFFE